MRPIALVCVVGELALDDGVCQLEEPRGHLRERELLAVVVDPEEPVRATSVE